jgi:hypothetical protein
MTPDRLTEIFEVHGEPALQTPVLVVALEGWVDAGLGATTATAALLGQAETEAVVTFNGELFLDQRARRPVAHIVNGITTELNWPRTVVRQGTDNDGNDVLFLVGPEPDFHWRSFTDAVVGLARSWRVRMVVGLGAFPAPAPHTRPVKLAATAPASCRASSRCRPAWSRRSRSPSGPPGPRWSACGPGCRTTWPACRSPRPARR